MLPNVNVIEQNSNFSSSHQTPMLVKAESRDDEETIFDSRKSSITSSENQINAKIVDKNLNIINLILILFGVLSISFIVSDEYTFLTSIRETFHDFDLIKKAEIIKKDSRLNHFILCMVVSGISFTIKSLHLKKILFNIHMNQSYFRCMKATC